MVLTLGHPSWGLYYAMITTVGSVLGGIFGYAIGWWGGRPLLRCCMKEERVAMIRQAFAGYAGWAILIAGLTPIPYKLFTLGAGAFSVNFTVFVVASLLSRGLRFFLVAGVLQLFGPWVKDGIEQYFNLLTILLVVVLAIGFWVVRMYTVKAIKSSPSPSRDV